MLCDNQKNIFFCSITPFESPFKGEQNAYIFLFSVEFLPLANKQYKNIKIYVNFLCIQPNNFDNITDTIFRVFFSKFTQKNTLISCIVKP